MAGVGHNSGNGDGGRAADLNAATVTVSLPTALLRLFPGSPNEVEVSAATVRDVIDALEERWPGMRDRLMDSRPSIRRHLNIFVGEDKATLQTPLTHGMRVTILTAMSGG